MGLQGISLDFGGIGVNI